MAKKIFQALKFTEGLDADLHTLAEMKKLSYNTYVEGILSNHVLVQKKALRELAKNHEIQEAPCVQTIEQKESHYS
jgi:ribosomal protein L20